MIFLSPYCQSFRRVAVRQALLTSKISSFPPRFLNSVRASYSEPVIRRYSMGKMLRQGKISVRKCAVVTLRDGRLIRASVIDGG